VHYLIGSQLGNIPSATELAANYVLQFVANHPDNSQQVTNNLAADKAQSTVVQEALQQL